MKYDIRPIENTNDEDSMKLDEKIRSQNEEYFEIYDYIVNNVPKHDQIRILNANGELIPGEDFQVNGLLRYSFGIQLINGNGYSNFVEFH